MCLSFVTVEDKSPDTVICPTCQHPLSVEEPSSDSPSLPKHQPSEGKYKIFVPLIYVVLFLPTIFTIYYLAASADKPAPIQEKGTPTEKPRQAPDPKPKPKPRGSSSEKPHKDSPSPTSPPPDPDESKLDTPPGTGLLPPPDSLAPPPRIIETKECGSLRITMANAVKTGVEAWVEIDGKRKAVWKANKTQVELNLPEGRYTVKIVWMIQRVRQTLYEDEIEILPDRVKEVRLNPGK
jgi:hypothetical protein